MSSTDRSAARIRDNNGHIHPLGHFCGSNCPKHRPEARSAAQDLDRISDIATEQAIHALARLRGNAADKQLIAHTIGLLGGRIEFLLDVPEIAAAIERNRRGW